MTIIKWDPLGNIAMLQDRINKLFDDSFPQRTLDDAARTGSAWTPSVDIYETECGIVIAVDLPGVNREDVAVEIKDNVLTISGERAADAAACNAAHYYRRERVCGKFYRTFTLHAVIPPEKIRAKFNHGVLMIELPGPEADPPRRVAVDID